MSGLDAGAVVVLALVNPAEKYWGRLLSRDASGIVLRGLNLSTFDDWMRSVAKDEPTFGLSTVFFPLLRVERMYLDETLGGVESLSERFERRVGVPVDDHLG